VNWETFLVELDGFAGQLLTLEETQLTAQALLAARVWFDHTWREGRLSSSDAIPVPTPRKKGLHPNNSELSSAEMSFQFELGEGIANSKLPAIAQFQVRVVGAAEFPNCIVELEDHWRVDTHNFEGEPREPHPLFHFQRGGYAQDAWSGGAAFVPGAGLPNRADDGYWRSLMQSPSPRIPVPPLCPMLAIDYVIGQHDGDVWTQLHNKPEYRQLVASAQRRLWLPFFEALSSAEMRARWLGSIWLKEAESDPAEEVPNKNGGYGGEQT
jgi:hypothetical protein